MSAPLLLEVGCEEIPARMIGAAAEDLRARVVAVLDAAGIAHGPSRAWGGTRRIAARVEDVAASIAGREQLVIGPPASAAFGADGRTPTSVALGFAKKQGIDASQLRRLETDKGVYAGFRRETPTRTLQEILETALPPAVTAMSFPKSMRWGAGTYRFVRPVHWIVALHGATPLRVELMGIASGRDSDGHRFLAPGPVVLEHADRYVEALRAAKVLVTPEDRRSALADALERAASALHGQVVRDEALLAEIVELVEWPGVVAGRFDPSFLDLPQEILVTTLRHHQKSFSVRGRDGLLPAFLSVANTDRDPAGHVRRGNEWVVVGRLDDARFFWNEDRTRTLESRVDDLARVTFHKKAGSYLEKTQRVIALAASIADRIEAAPLPVDRAAVVTAARLAKADLTTGLVGEFPELQGVVGGLLLRAEGAGDAIATAVAEHYKPAGAEDEVPESVEGCTVAIADRLDTMRALIGSGETVTGSRDPFGLRRAAVAVFRILAERDLPVCPADLFGWAGPETGFREFLQDRLINWLADRGFTANEVQAVRRPSVDPTVFDSWSLGRILERLKVVATLRGRPDFFRLVELTKRVDNILAKQPEVLEPALQTGAGAGYRETHASALALDEMHERIAPLVIRASEADDFGAIVDHLSGFAAPVAKFFDDVLVLDPANPAATRWRCELLARLRTTLTRDFDIRELAGQADSTR